MSFSDATIHDYGNVWRNGAFDGCVRPHFNSKRCLNRGYPLKKIQENNEAEIMEVVLDEARSSYPEQIVVDLKSEGAEDLEANVARLVDWIHAWRKDRGLEQDHR